MYTARQHPGLEVTGLSEGVGGWLGRRAFRFDDPVFAGAFPEAAARVRQRLDDLLGRGEIRLNALPAPLDHRRGVGPLGSARVRGILFGLAVGDALGNTSESMAPNARYSRYGEIRDYLPNRHADGLAIGLPSDDTQLAVWTLESLLARGEPDVTALASAYRQHRLFGIGRTMKSFFRRCDEVGPGGDPWRARQESAGNGALMRMPGAFLPHAWTLDGAALDTVALTSALTHDHASSTAACVAFCEILRGILCGNSPVRDGYFWETYVEVARPLEANAQLRSRVPGDGFTGPVWQLVAERVPRALREGDTALQAGNRWYSGAFLLETVPTALFILERYRDQPEECLVRAVMDTWDNDTTAAIVGAVLGALHGIDAFPQRWLTALSGRTEASDDGRVGRAYDRLREYGGFGLYD